MKRKKTYWRIIYHFFVSMVGLLMLYPLFWMLMSSFKESNTIFTTAGQLIPSKITFENYFNGWQGFGVGTFSIFFKNSLIITILASIGTLLSSSLSAYGFARCPFKGQGILFAAMLASMMLPGQILMVPQYLWYKKLGWVGSFAPLIVPHWFAIQGFFVYLMMNFIGGIPKELDEAAQIDGCSYFSIFARIILPLMRPAFVTSAIFSFMWRWDDFMSALLYINKVEQYPVSLALKLFADPASSSDYGAMFAMAILSLVPILIIFFVFQKQLVEGVATSGIKG